MAAPLAEWKRLQEEWSRQVLQADDVDWAVLTSEQEQVDEGHTRLDYVGGLDISFAEEGGTGAHAQHAVACLTVLQLPDLDVVYQDSEPVDLNVPYVSGYLGFREVPTFTKLLQRCPEPRPQVLLVDGNGVLHHRRCGSASHLGVALGMPTIGVGKQLLAVDGLEEWLVVKELRAALAQERGAVEDIALDQLTLQSPSHSVTGQHSYTNLHAMATPDRSVGGSAGDLTTHSADISPVPSAMLPITRNGSNIFAGPGVPRPFFNWQVVTAGHPAAAAPHPGQAHEDMALAAALAASGNLAADSGPMLDPLQGGAGPPGRMAGATQGMSGSADEGTLLPAPLGRTKSQGGFEPMLPGGEETDDDTGLLRRNENANSRSGSRSRYYVRRGRDNMPVVCVDLVSQQDGAQLGVAAAGLAGTRKPVYISVGHKLSLDTALGIVIACCKHRIPEPIRQADLQSRREIRESASAADNALPASAQPSDASPTKAAPGTPETPDAGAPRHIFHSA